jgi:cyclopropane-fatty-acyl-phospholipid synthase
MASAAPEWARELVTGLAARAGVTINGRGPCDLVVNDERFFERVARDGSLGLGESYMDGWWDTPDLAGLHHRIAGARLGDSHESVGWRLVARVLRARLSNLQSRRRADRRVEQHYDQTDRAYRCMTDSWITLSCGYWAGARDLESSQEAKLDLVCRKLGFVPASTCSTWAAASAPSRGSRQPATAAGSPASTSRRGNSRSRARAGRRPPGRVRALRLSGPPRRFAPATFDRAASMGMFEHVGYRNFRAYMEAVRPVLKQDGLFLLHTVGSDVTVERNDPWFDRYIFMNGMLPSIAQLGESFEGLFTMEDWHNFGNDYAKTLRAWFEQFDERWPEPRDTAFYRMWKYYLLCSAGQFSSRRLQLWHLVLARQGVPGGYATVR